MIQNERVILRDFIEGDIEDRIRWELHETEWQHWDAPWEYEENDFDPEAYRASKMNWLAKEKDENRMRYTLEICINNEEQTHIGWVSAYDIDEDYNYTEHDGKLAVGIDIPSDAARGKGYGLSALKLYIQYLQQKGIEEIYTQTWSGNIRMIGLAEKLGFKECCRKKGMRIVKGEKYDALTFRYEGLHQWEENK